MKLHEWLRPLSPYKTRTDLPSYRLMAITNDGPAHGWPRLGLMLLWCIFGGVLSAIVNVMWLALADRAHPWISAGIAVGVLLIEKIANVLDHRYPIDVLDWCCDAVSLGGLGAYLVSCLVVHATPSVWVIGACTLLWSITYPWSTPR